MSRGTGTLIGKRTVLTALHVVADRHANPPVPHQGQITLTFPGGTTTGSIVDRLMDAQADWVILECANPPHAEPVPMDAISRDDVSWETFGFPDANPRDGMVQSGTVEAIHAELDGVPVHQLYSKQAAAGDGAPVKGFSGAPVLVEDHLVGVLRFALMKDNRTVAGTLYACPTASVALRRTAAITLAHRSRWRWLILLPVLAPLVVAALLHFVPVRAARVRMDALVNRVGMTLIAEQQLFAAPVRLDTLRAFYLLEALLPLEDGRSEETDRVDIMTRQVGGFAGSIVLDEFPVPGGTGIILEKATAPTEFIVAFIGPVPALTASVDGPVMIRVGAGDDILLSPELNTLTLTSDSSGLELDISAAAGVALEAIGPLRVRDLDFTHFRKGEASQVQRSTISGGRLTFSDSRAASDTVLEGDLLVFRQSEGTLRIHQMDEDGLTLTFEGTVTGTGGSGHPMPSQLAWLLGSHLPATLGLAGAYLLVTTFLIRHRLRRAL